MYDNIKLNKTFTSTSASPTENEQSVHSFNLYNSLNLSLSDVLDTCQSIILSIIKFSLGILKNQKRK